MMCQFSIFIKKKGREEGRKECEKLATYTVISLCLPLAGNQ